jgi:hypothetical protein
MRTAANGRIEKGALSERGAPFSCLHTRRHLSGGFIVGVIAAAQLTTGGIAYTAREKWRHALSPAVGTRQRWLEHVDEAA